MALNQPLLQRALKRWSEVRGRHAAEGPGRMKLPAMPQESIMAPPATAQGRFQATGQQSQHGGESKAMGSVLDKQSQFFRKLRKHGSLHTPAYLAGKARRPPA
jgi:hypothetical protein